MPIAVECPGCHARLNAPDAAAGKRVKCPKCQTPMLVPAPEAAAPDFEVVDEPTPPKPAKPAPVAKKPAAKPPVEDDEDDDDRPRPKRRPVPDDDEDDDRPRARRRPADDDEDDDDEDDRPRRTGKGRGRKPAKAGMSPGVLVGAIAGGVVLLGGVAFAVYWFGFRDPDKSSTAGTNTGPGGGMRLPGSGGGPPGGGNGTFQVLSSNNLKQIALGVHAYHDRNSAFPGGIYDATGKLGLSWRVAVLPYIEQEALYKQFKLDEPWDSPHNQKLIPQMPRTYAAPGGTAGPGMTYYRTFTGPGTIFPPLPPAQKGTPGQMARGLTMARVSDGLSNTALVVEAADPVEWTKPDELEYAAGKPLPRLGGVFGDGFHVATGDGFVRFLPRSTPEQTLRALITAEGGEIVELP